MAEFLWIKGEQALTIETFRPAATLLEAELKKPGPAKWDQRTTLATAYAATGRAAEARALIETVQRDDCCRNPVTRADILAGIAFTDLLLGDKEAAIAALGRMIDEPSDISWRMVALAPAWRSLRGEPAFAAMIERARLHDAATTTARN